jgi:hypothetical protein
MFELASRQAFHFAANESAGNLPMMQQLQAILINFGRLARSGLEATAAAVPNTQLAPAITNPSKPKDVGRHAHTATRLTKGKDPQFKAAIVQLQGEVKLLGNELRALYEETGIPVPKTTALPKKKAHKRQLPRPDLGPPKRVPISAGPKVAQALCGPMAAETSFQDHMALQRQKWRRKRIPDGSPGALVSDGSLTHTPMVPTHTPMVPANTPVVFALSAAEVSVAIASSTNHTAAGSGIHAQEDRATPNGAPHVVGCRVVDVTTQQGEQEVVEMLTCADLLHGKQKCTVVRGRLPVDPAIMTGRPVDLEDAWMRNIWNTFKATGVEKHERKRVDCAWDYTGQMEMEFYPKGTRTATIKRGDSDKRIMAMIDPGREGAGVVTSCGWMIHGFSTLEGGNFLKARASSDSDSD